MGALTTTTGQPWSGRLASGPAALTVVLRVAQCLVPFVVAGALASGAAFGLWGSHDARPFWIVFDVWVALTAVIVGLSVLYIVQDIRETRRSYTTTYNRMQSLAQLDRRTHQIVRAPGAPYITWRRRGGAPR